MPNNYYVVASDIQVLIRTSLDGVLWEHFWIVGFADNLHEAKWLQFLEAKGR